MNLRFRPQVNGLEERATPSGTDPLNPDGSPVNPTTPAQTTPPSTTPVNPPLDPHGP